MSVPRIQEDCVGVVLTVTLPDLGDPGTMLDLTGATSIKFVFYSPSGDITTEPGSVSNVLGIVTYTTTNEEFNEPGDWGVQVTVTYSASRIYNSAIGIIRVVANERPGDEIAS